MAKLVIVAIPSEDDYVWKISSQRIPHLTLLYLGDAMSNPRVSRIAEFLRHAADQSLNRFGLEVDRRGTLGPDQADVLFFSRDWWIRDLEQFRSMLLKNDDIRKAYDSVEQYEEWTPHLTLGYPDTPARPDNRDYPGFHFIHFNKVALWFGDYQGVEIPLRVQDYMDIRMSDLKHYGVKGMRWGVRRKDIGGPREVVVRTTPGRMAKKTKIKTSGGQGLPASRDAVNAAVAKQKVKKSGVDTLSNEELQGLVTRLNLERQLVSHLPDTNPYRRGIRFVANFNRTPEGRITINAAKAAARSRRVRRAIATAATSAALAL